MTEEFDTVEAYLHYRTYPDALSKGEKANLRRKCRNNFKFKEGVLYYKVAKTVGGDEPWSVCIRTEKEKIKIMDSYHWRLRT